MWSELDFKYIVLFVSTLFICRPHRNFCITNFCTSVVKTARLIFVDQKFKNTFETVFKLVVVAWVFSSRLIKNFKV